MCTDLGLQRSVVGCEVGDEERVLVVIAYAADIGSAEDVHDHVAWHGVWLLIRAGHVCKVCEKGLTCTLRAKDNPLWAACDGTSSSRSRVGAESSHALHAKHLRAEQESLA